jgi:RNA polymerase sigma-70 factor (ECF subfamily)
MAPMGEDTAARRLAGLSPRETFDRCYPRLCHFFRSRGFSEDETDDLTQDTLVRVIKNMDKLRTPASIEAWILRVAANVWKNELRFRQAKKRKATELSLDAPLEGGPDLLEAAAVRNSLRPPDSLEQLLAADELAATLDCLEQLPPGMRRCLVLHVFGSRQYREISDLLKLSIESVKSHIHQARHRLEECVAKKHAGGAK